MKHSFRYLYLYALFAILLFLVILCFPKTCLSFALNGLQLWFDKMIPALFPFMVLSGIIIRMDLIKVFVRFIYPFLGKLFCVSPPCVYGMVVGFLCGFPMGAHTVSQLYLRKQLSKREASFLLAFCNNIGPVYFLGFVVPILKLDSPGLYLFGMYGLPLLYGLILRYTVYSGSLSTPCSPSAEEEKTTSFFTALDASISNALSGITKLGGYIVFFNLLFILPVLIFSLAPLSVDLKNALTGGSCCLLEITGGIGRMQGELKLLILCILPFGGLSCIAQTHSMISETDLSIREYVMHKMILTAITVLFYLLAEATAVLP